MSGWSMDDLVLFSLVLELDGKHAIRAGGTIYPGML